MRIAFNQKAFRRFLQKSTLGSLSIMIALWIARPSPAMTVENGTSTRDSSFQNAPPALSDFTVTSTTGNLWTFSGSVSDENPAGCVVVFGGMLEGRSVMVEEDGTFSYTIELPTGSGGTVSATAIDEEDLESMSAETFIF